MEIENTQKFETSIDGNMAKNGYSTPITSKVTRAGRPMDGSRWSAPSHVFGEVTAAGMSGTRSKQNYSYKTDFETRRENQNFGRQNISMSLPPLDSTPLGTNNTTGIKSPIDSIPVKKNAILHATDTTNGFIKAKRKSARASGTGVRPIIVRLIMEQI